MLKLTVGSRLHKRFVNWFDVEETNFAYLLAERLIIRKPAPDRDVQRTKKWIIWVYWGRNRRSLGNVLGPE